MKHLLRTIIFIMVLNHSYCQISINPMILFIDKNTKSGVIDILNPTKEIREYKIEFKFGYPKYDSLGNQTMEYEDTEFEKEFSLIPYLKYFPKKLMIPPGETQTVKFFVKNLPENFEGTLWTRIHVESQPVVKQIDTGGVSKDQSSIKATIEVKSVVNGIIFYQIGNLTSSMDIKYKEKVTDLTNTYFLFDVIKMGNSPFLGVCHSKIFDINENILYENKENIAIYKNSVISIKVKTSILGSGASKIEVIINNERKNIPKEFQIPFKPISKFFSIFN